jgi:hypothetical protein
VDRWVYCSCNMLKLIKYVLTILHT